MTTFDPNRYHPEFYAEIGRAMVPDGVVVEIGARTGEWLSGLLEVCTPARVFAIDRWPATGAYALKRNFPQWHARLAKYGSMVSPIRGTSQEWGRVWPEDWRPDTLFVDGSHRYAQALDDLRTWWPLLRPGGTMFVHDTNEPEVERALLDWWSNARVGKLRSAHWGPNRILTTYVRKTHETPQAGGAEVRPV